MTAPRPCRACGAELHGDVMWCLRCYEPVRQLTPRAQPLPPLPSDELIDPAEVRPDYTPLRLAPTVYSRTLVGPTSFGLLGRLAVTAVILALSPVTGWIGPLGFVYLIGFLPIAIVVLRSTWAKTPVQAGRVLVLPPERSRSAMRACVALFGGAIAAVGVASGGSWLAAIPGAILLVTAITPAWNQALLGISEMMERPVALVLALNALNVLDVLATDAAIRAGEATELNPFVGAAGTGVKLALVLACSLVLLRVRPRALIWPCIAFVALTVYHLTGWFVMA